MKKNTLGRCGIAATAALVLALAGCGGSSGGSEPPPPPTPVSVQQALTQAAAVPANDTSENTSASFSVLQDAGVPAVTVNSPPKVNFAVFSDGAIKQLQLRAVRALAQLVPEPVR